MTIRELRKSLFNINNQDMTIKELRTLLFECPQEEVVNENFLAELEKKNKQV